MKTIVVLRDTIGRKQCLGNILVFNKHHNLVYNKHVLERGWRNNQRNISCIPAGTYTIKLEWSPKFQRDLWEIYGVQNRSECKIHAANFWPELNGCLAPGESRFNIGRDAEQDMINSGNALEEFHEAMGSDKEARIIIINARHAA